MLKKAHIIIFALICSNINAAQREMTRAEKIELQQQRLQWAINVANQLSHHNQQQEIPSIPQQIKQNPLSVYAHDDKIATFWRHNYKGTTEHISFSPNREKLIINIDSETMIFYLLPDAILFTIFTSCLNLSCACLKG